MSSLSAHDIVSLSRRLDELMALKPEAREAWFAALPAGESHLAGPLRQMLADSERGDDAEGLSTLPKLGDQASQRAADSGAAAGERVGPYRLKRELGRGGMGSVWLAERADGAYHRQVALKLPRVAWGAALAERMERERDIGALLEHPAIARLYDAGVDAKGRPFIAMEVIDGIPIDQYCRRHALSVADRLRLFVQVVRAVAYAHGRLVIHRDLKPGNVLVDAQGKAHLLDFGIAKLLLDESGISELNLTQDNGRMMTPHYASPEQITGKAMGVQADVFSLGVMLYELLTGVLPHVPKRQTLGAIEEAILEGHVPPASSRVHDRPTVRALRGEIDAILAKAMQREPSARYASAEALARDIEHHLDGRSITARRDEPWQRLAKSVRRHRHAYAAGAGVALALVVGSVIALTQAHRAEREAHRSQIVKEFVVDIFKANENGPEMRQLPAEVLLDRGARLIEQRFAGQADMQAELYGVVTRILLDLGAAQQAVDYGDRHVKALKAAGGSGAALARAELLLAQALNDGNRLADARAHAQAALAAAPAKEHELAARARLRIAATLIDDRQHEAAERELSQVDALLAAATKPAPAVAAQAKFERGRILANTNRFDAAEPLLVQAIAAAEADADAGSRTPARMRMALASYLSERGEYKKADAAYAAAFAAMRASGGPDDVGAALAEAEAAFDRGMVYRLNWADAEEAIARNLAALNRQSSRVPGAVLARVGMWQGCLRYRYGLVESGYAQLAETVALLRRLEPQKRGGFCLGLAAIGAGKHDVAERELAAAIAQYNGQRSPESAPLFNALAENRLMVGNIAGARAALDSGPAETRMAGAGNERAMHYTHTVSMTRAQIELEAQNPQAALAALQSVPDSADGQTVEMLALRGAVLCATGRPAEGLERLRRAIDRLAATSHPHSPVLAHTRARAGLCALGSGQAQQATTWAMQAREAFAAQPGVSPFFKAPLARLESALGLPRSVL
jgi:serine/threonine-protein kinase